MATPALHPGRSRNFHHLRGRYLDEVDGAPSSSAYRTRFGSLLRAYQLVGFSPDRDYRYVEVNRALRRLHPEIVAQAMAGIRDVGGAVEQDPATDLLTVNGEFTVSIVLARCQETPSGTVRWHIRLDTGLAPDITVAVRMAPGNASIRDYYLLPRRDATLDRLRIGETNDLLLEAFRFDTLDALADLARRVSIMEAA
ncbi:hypothetical protein FHS88_004155 [Roseomonas alkaliterrae]|uniref:Uncharacterized protein n=1 Tax=Neoroseomonas alkaliterrae TaxID=1452450 RepID=A0A840XTG6_9PROT|nr:hypothetical protein [Neoroseomonas alkaliterrae]MBB5691988.1 hypothetical protein [Neoroseomonas alkaliterrae]